MLGGWQAGPAAQQKEVRDWRASLWKARAGNCGPAFTEEIFFFSLNFEPGGSPLRQMAGAGTEALLLLDGGSFDRVSLGSLRKPPHALILVHKVPASQSHFQ